MLSVCIYMHGISFSIIFIIIFFFRPVYAQSALLVNSEGDLHVNPFPGTLPLKWNI